METIGNMTILCYRGDLTLGWDEENKEEMQFYQTDRLSVYTITDEKVFFFTDDYCLGHNYIPKCFVSSSTQIPHNVEPREELPDGVIRNVKDYIMIYEKDKRQLNTIDELIEYLNENYSLISKASVE